MPLVHDELREAFALMRWPEKLSPSEWAERHRILTRDESARPGAFSLSKSPWARGFLDAFADDSIEEVVIAKGVQTSATESCITALGWIAEQTGDPALFLLPDETLGRKVVALRILPLFEKTPVLQSLLTGKAADLTLDSIKLANGFSLLLGWAGSPSSISSFARKYVVEDEVDKYPPPNGREASAADLAEARTTTYGSQRKVVKSSTPTTKAGLIWQAWLRCPIQQYWHVPCPHCGQYQRFVVEQLRWEKFTNVTPAVLAEMVYEQRAAWMECIHCAGRIEQHHKPEILNRGRWATLEESVQPDGTVVGHRPRSRKVGFHISGLYPEWVELAAIAKACILAEHFPENRQHLANSLLGLPVEDTEQKVEPLAVEKLHLDTVSRGIAPWWVKFVILTIDVQVDRFYWLLRGWGYGGRSVRLRHDSAISFHDLERVLTTPAQRTDGHKFRILKCGIDQQYRTVEVLQWIAHPTRREIVVPMSGEDDGPSENRFLRKSTSSGGNRNQAAKLNLVLHHHNAHACKDRIALLIGSMIEEVHPETGEVLGESPRWALDSFRDETYLQHLCSEEKKLVRVGREPARLRWVKRPGADNHYLDCESMQIALAWSDAITISQPDPQPARPQRPTPADTQRESNSAGRRPFTRRYG